MAWVARAGVDVAAWLGKYEDRLISCHIKDIAPAGENTNEDGWADIGDGTMDWGNLWGRCRSTPAKWFVVEHDKPSDGPRFARRSFAFLTGLGA